MVQQSQTCPPLDVYPPLTAPIFTEERLAEVAAMPGFHV
jgi:hypothetical protein